MTKSEPLAHKNGNSAGSYLTTARLHDEGTTVNREQIISTLNDLIENCKDCEKGFRSCSESVKESRLKIFLSALSSNSAIAVRELHALIRSLGGPAPLAKTGSGHVCKRWLDVRANILGLDDEEILGECERGENSAIRSYSHALNSELTPEIEGVLKRQFHGILKNQELLESLRCQMA